MELLGIVEARIGRWLAYADYCVNTGDALERCQPFWTFVAVALGIVCLIAAGGVGVKLIIDRGNGSTARGNTGHKTVS